MMTVRYIEPKDLAEKLLSDKKILVVDVRDSDYEIGKIKGSVNVPYCSLHKSLSDLQRLSQDYECVVFHCHFSARRGPSAADIFDSSFEAGREVLVLSGGFEKWHRLYKRNSDLYEAL